MSVVDYDVARIIHYILGHLDYEPILYQLYDDFQANNYILLKIWQNFMQKNGAEGRKGMASNQCI